MNRSEKSKIKAEERNLKTQERRKEKVKEPVQWIVTIMILSFGISFFMSLISETTLPKIPLYLGILILILFILLGVLFDMIGVAVTASDEKVFHSMNSRKVKGADIAVLFKKNSDKVASFCNDVIGDICGVVSGSAGITIATSLASNLNLPIFFVTLMVTSFIASLTITGKALGKSLAINKSNRILFQFSKFVANFYKIKK